MEGQEGHVKNEDLDKIIKNSKLLTAVELVCARDETLNAIRVEADTELRAELFRAAVEVEKRRLRGARWWHMFMPFKIVRRDM